MLSKHHENPQKRVLGKVRRHFTIKKEEEDQNDVVDSCARFITDSNVYTLSDTIGLVEINRKIFLGPQYLNLHFTISKSFIQEKLSSRTVLLSLCSENKHILPSEYTMKRLESFGDLELATWAHRMTKFQRNYPKLMDGYLANRKLNNPAEVMHIKETLCKMQEEIENKYSYYKVVKRYSRTSSELSEISFSEDFLRAMGHSVESFMNWTEKNGLPAVFDHECPVYLNTIKRVLDGSVLSSNYVSKGQEYETSIIDKNGQKRSVHVQSICLLEPTEEGYIMNGYFILKKAETKKHSWADNLHFSKQRKMEDNVEKDMENETERTRTDAGES